MRPRPPPWPSTAGRSTTSSSNAALLTLPAPGATGSLSKSNIVVDTTAPTVTGVSSTAANGTYGVGSVITITVGWSKPVVVTGTPQLALNSGGTASYASGSGTSTLTFTYTVAAGQDANPLDYISSTALTLNGGTIFDTVGPTPTPPSSPCPHRAPTGSLGKNKSITIDTTAPAVTGVSSATASGTYGVGSVIDITVAWSKAVVVTGTPELALNSGGTASYSSGSGTSTLTFTYTVAAGQSANPLDEASTSALSLNGGTIFDTVGTNPNAAILTLPAPGSAGSLGKNKSIVIDTTSPAVTAVSSTTAAGSYGVGSVITITVAWSKAVVVTGTPQLALNSGGTASYSSGSGTSTLTFTYTVRRRPERQPAGRGLDHRPDAQRRHDRRPERQRRRPHPAGAGLVQLAVPEQDRRRHHRANGDGRLLDQRQWHLRRRLGDRHHRRLERGGGGHRHAQTGAQLRRHGQLQSGSGTSTLTFTYTVAAGQSANPLDEASAAALTLNGGTIFDTVGTNSNAAVLTLPAPGTTARSARTSRSSSTPRRPQSPPSPRRTPTAPMASARRSTSPSAGAKPSSSPARRNWRSTPAARPATASGSGTSTLTFTYTVAAGQNANPLDYATDTALTLNGGTIFDTVDQPQRRRPHPARTGIGRLALQDNIAIDTTAPTVTGVTSTTANGTYGVGSVITITVAWSKPVVVTGTPQLALNSGGTASYCQRQRHQHPHLHLHRRRGPEQPQARLHQHRR